MTLDTDYVLRFKTLFIEVHCKNLNEDKLILSAAKNVPQRLYSFNQYKVYVDIRGGSQEKWRQTTVGRRKRRFSVLSLMAISR